MLVKLFSNIAREPATMAERQGTTPPPGEGISLTAHGATGAMRPNLVNGLIY
jgi:hypothetical protein